MKLKKIFKNISIKSIKGSKEIEITGICNDSRKVFPGNLFIARKGREFDGMQFIDDAVSSGAIAVVCDVFNPFLKSIVQVIHEDISSIEALIANNYYQHPSKDLFCVGITGTNGKTTTSYLIKHLLDCHNYQSGLIGTIEYFLGKIKTFADRTTPDCVTLQKSLREILNNNLKAAVLEVTSHGLDQNRVENVDFDIAIFTNLSQDHLDYHKSIEEYASKKQKLFTSLAKDSFGIINKDDLFSTLMIEKSKAQILSYGIENDADIYAKDIDYFDDKTMFTVVYKDLEERFISPLVGRFNVYNVLAAIALGITKSFSLSSMKNSIRTFQKVKGRLEKVEIKKPFSIFIDFAHTEDALLNVLKTLFDVKKRDIITVFGCGGERDEDKREKMARVCEKFSDYIVVTNDNPRREDPNQIIQDIVKGFTKKDCFCVECDRKKAIEKAILLAKENDIILIAGKGCESKQIFSNRAIDFDDYNVAKEICETL